MINWHHRPNLAPHRSTGRQDWWSHPRAFHISKGATSRSGFYLLQVVQEHSQQQARTGEDWLRQEDREPTNGESDTHVQWCVSGGENKVKFLIAEVLRGVNSTIFDVRGRRQRDTAKQKHRAPQGSRCATTGASGTDAAQGSEAQQLRSIDEIVDITVSVQKQKPSTSKTLSANQKDSTVEGFRKSW